MNCWFMFDNHTFAQVAIAERSSMIEQIKKLFEKDGCGSLCAKDEFGASLEALWLHGQRQPDGHYGLRLADIENWVDRVLEECAFRRLMMA